MGLGHGLRRPHDQLRRSVPRHGAVGHLVGQRPDAEVRHDEVVPAVWGRAVVVDRHHPGILGEAMQRLASEIEPFWQKGLVVVVEHLDRDGAVVARLPSAIDGRPLHVERFDLFDTFDSQILSCCHCCPYPKAFVWLAEISARSAQALPRVTSSRQQRYNIDAPFGPSLGELSPRMGRTMLQACDLGEKRSDLALHRVSGRWFAVEIVGDGAVACA